MHEIMCFDKYGNSIDEFVQWDINRMMYIDWEYNCIPIFQFGNTKSDRLLVVKGRIIEDETKKIAEVNVPNIMLQQAYPIIGFVYLESEVNGDDNYYNGKTIYKFKIPVRAKAKPQDYKYSENTEYISWIKLKDEAREYLDELKNEVDNFLNEYEHDSEVVRDSADRAEQAIKKNEEYVNIVEHAVEEVKEYSVSATLSQSYAVGGTNTRFNEDTDNAKYYYQSTKIINDSLNGVFSPQGTIQFSELQSAVKGVGCLYNISDSFITDDTFKCGAGISYSAGTNVYYTSDGYWDCLVGSMNIESLIDKTLKFSGKAADAKVVGDAIEQLNEDISNAGCIEVDLSDCENVGEPNTINADTLGGKHENELHVAKAVDADTLGGIPAEQYVTKDYIVQPTKIYMPRNLLDNSDFAINQRGITECTTNAWKYTIDRWKISHSTLVVSDGYIRLIATGTELYKHIKQITETTLRAGKQYTIAIKSRVVEGEGAQLVPVSATNDSIENCGRVDISNSNDFVVTVWSFTPQEDVENFGVDLYVPYGKSEILDIEWIAAYEGEYTEETLPEYQPKGYATELAECQRYYYQSWDGDEPNGLGVLTREAMWACRISGVTLPQTMRDIPDIKLYPDSGEESTIKEWVSGTAITGAGAYNKNTKSFIIGTEEDVLEVGKHYFFHYSASADFQ